MIKTGIVVLLLSNLGNVFQYLSQFVLGRALSPEEFGIFNAINSLSILVTSIAVCISFSTAKEFILLGEDRKVRSLFITDLIKKTAPFGLIAVIVCAISSKFIADYLFIESLVPLLIYSGIIFGVGVQAVLTGIFQGLSRYVLMSVGLTLQAGFRLIFIVIAVVVLKFSYNGALTAVFLSYILSSIFFLYYLADHIFVGSADGELPKGIYRQMFTRSIPMAFTWAYLGIISNIDIPLVKHFFPEYETGIYSAGAIIARIVWFLPSVLVYVMFPEIVRSDTGRESSVTKVLIIGGLTCAISAGVAIFFYFFPQPVIRTLMGAKYDEAVRPFVVLGFAMAVVSALNVMFNFYLAKAMTFFLYPSYAVLIGIIAGIYVYFHSSLVEVAYVFLFGLLITLIINLFLFYFKYKLDIVDAFMQLRRDHEYLRTSK